MSNFFNYSVSLGVFKEDKKNYVLHASKEDCLVVTKRFSMGDFESIEFSYSCQKVKEDYLDILVLVKSKVFLTCSITGQEFTHYLDKTFILRFTTEKNLKEKEEDMKACPPVYIENVETMNEKVCLGEVFLQYLSLFLPDYPKSSKSEENLESKNQKSRGRENPFNVLKGLKR